MKVAGDHAHKSQGKDIALGPDSTLAQTQALRHPTVLFYIMVISCCVYLLSSGMKKLNFQIPN